MLNIIYFIFHILFINVIHD